MKEGYHYQSMTDTTTNTNETSRAAKDDDIKFDSML